MAELTSLYLQNSIRNISVDSQPSVFESGKTFEELSSQVNVVITTNESGDTITQNTGYLYLSSTQHPETYAYYTNTFTKTISGGYKSGTLGYASVRFYDRQGTQLVPPNYEFRIVNDDGDTISFFIATDTYLTNVRIVVRYTYTAYKSYDPISLYALRGLSKNLDNSYEMTFTLNNVEYTFTDTINDTGTLTIKPKFTYQVDSGGTGIENVATFNLTQVVANGLSGEITSATLQSIPTIDLSSQTLEDILSQVDIEYYLNGTTLIVENALSFFNQFADYDNDATHNGFVFFTDGGDYSSDTIVASGNESNFQFSEVRASFTGGSAIFTFTFYYFDNVASALKQFSFSSQVNINGIASISIVPIDEYIADKTALGVYNTLQINYFAINLIDGFGAKTRVYIASNDFYATKDGTTIYDQYNLSSGVWSVYYQYRNRNDLPYISSSCSLYVYDYDTMSVNITPQKTEYLVGQTIQQSDIVVMVSYEIADSQETYTYQTYAFSYSPKKLTTIGTQTISVVVGGNTYTYNVIVSRDYTEYVYYFDKKDPYKRHYLGEISDSYNINFVLDKTKDSCKITIYNSIGEDIKPNTIVYLISTDTWWVVQKDNVSRYEREENALWKHEISLIGAIEILSNRDLTNCAFYKNRYTYETFLNRLFALSDFEFSVDLDFEYIIGTTNIPYTKTFENFTPLTALNQFLSGINCVGKMSFETREVDGDFYITNATLHIIPNSGIDNEIHISTLDGVEENVVSNKNNYGTRTMSNAQNVIGNNVIRYPQYGFMNLDSDSYETTSANAYFRLPTNAYEVESIEMVGKNVAIDLYLLDSGLNETFIQTIYANGNCYNPSTLQELYNDILNAMNNVPSFDQRDIDSFVAHEQDFYDSCKENLTFKLTNGTLFDITKSTNEILAKSFLSLEPHSVLVNAITGQLTKKYGFGDINFANSGLTTGGCIYWEQGSNKISDFSLFGKNQWNIDDYEKTLSFTKDLMIQVWTTTGDGNNGGGFIIRTKNISVRTHNIGIAVNYIPMESVKLKMDNNLYENDTHLYNQTGKMTDGFALNKLIKSNSKEISSHEITRTNTYYNFFDIPKVGTIVDNYGEKYVINNVSISVYFNEDNENYYFCELTMTKQIATKSLLVSADKTIRDYDIPQKETILRQQLYRDYVELGYELEHSETPYANTLSYIFNFGEYNYGDYAHRIGLIKVLNEDYATYLYYQKSITKLHLGNTLISICNFGNNSIMGYSKAKADRFNWNLSTFFNKTRLVQVPIYYTDSNAEISYCQVLYMNDNSYTNAIASDTNSDYIGVSLQAPYISENVYTSAYGNEDIKITESEYNKDAIEIPYFEHIFEINDNDNIVIGERFLEPIELPRTIGDYVQIEDNDEVYDNVLGYRFTISDSAVSDENNSFDGDRYLNLFEKRVQITYDNDTRQLVIKFLSNYSQPYTTSLLHKNIAIYRIKYTWNTNTQTYIANGIHFILGINNCQVEQNANGEITLYVNNYKLK